MSEKKASQATDGSEGGAIRSSDTKLSNMQTFEDAARMARATRKWELAKSTGAQPSKTVDSLPKMRFTTGEIATSHVWPARMSPRGGGDRSPAGQESVAANKEYTGEAIYKEVQPATHLVQRGDTLANIGRHHLGPIASEQEVQKHVKEIAKINGIKNPDLISSGRQLQLPGHTSEGGFIITDDEGNQETTFRDGSVLVNMTDGTGYSGMPGGTENHFGPNPEDNYQITSDGGIVRTYPGDDKRTTWDNGVVKTEYPDGSGKIRTSQEGGTYSEHHWGPRAEQNYDLIKTAAGGWMVIEQPGDAQIDETGAKDPRVDSAKLDELAENKITDPERRANFQADMHKFGERAARQGLSQEQIAETYEQISRLLDTPGEQPVTQTDRIKLAQEVMHAAAHPTECDQGYHHTCSVASLEVRTYARDPAAAARLVADVATTGEFKTADGSMIKIDSNSLQRDFEAGKSDHTTGDRNYASQIFQVTAANIYWQRQDKRPYDQIGLLEGIGMIFGLTDGNKIDKGSIHYEQCAPVPGMHPPGTGERLVDYSRNPPQLVVDSNGDPVDFPDLTSDDITDVSNQITGKKERDITIRNKERIGGDSSIRVGSVQDLEDALASAKDKRRLPIIISVHTGNQPFFSDSGADAAGGSGDWHAVNITDYDAASGLVSVDNQWGTNNDRLTGDRRISSADLYKATSSPKN